MKNTKYLLSFLLLITTHLNAQEITVNIDADFYQGADISLVVISDELGKILYEEVVMEEDLSKDFQQTFERYLDRQHHVTIFNEYASALGNNYYKIRTFYDVQEELVVYGSDSYQFLEQEYIDLKLNVHGVNELHGIIMNSGTQDNYRRVRNKSKQELLKIKYELPIASDLYFVLHGNKEHFFRYIYIPEEEIFTRNDVLWEYLPTDLKEHQFLFPDKDRWNGYIRATSELTDNTCYFYELAQDHEYVATHKYFVPETLFFYDYEFYFTRLAVASGSSRRYTYYGKLDEPLGVPEIVEQDFDLDLEYYDKNGFDVKLVEKMDEVFFDCFLDEEKKDVTYNFGPLWVIKAQNTDKINFKYPKLSNLMLNIMPNLKYSEENYPMKIQQVKKKEGACDIIVTDYFSN